MKGSEIALASLMREKVGQPCINYSWMSNSSYMSKLAGRDYWSDREGVFFEYLRRCGINYFRYLGKRFHPWNHDNRNVIEDWKAANPKPAD